MLKDHKFFERHLDNNLLELSDFLAKKLNDLSNGKIPNISKEEYDAMDNRSPATNLGPKYNIFQFHNEAIYDLFLSVREMVKEASDYYGIDYNDQKYMIQGWFNFDKYEKPHPLPDSFLHDHLNGQGAPDFHGYYCVNAEPSNTQYKIGGIDGNRFANKNINNRAILSETGHPHGIETWSKDDYRITIAYDISPLKSVYGDSEQHWIPLG